MKQYKYEAVVIGVSAGGLKALRTFVAALSPQFRLPVIIVQHIGAHSDGSWIALLGREGRRIVREAEEKDTIEPGTIYIAPPNYHLLVEKDHTFTLTIAERVNFARPSVDVLFETAAEAYREGLIGIILTGSGSDGSRGMAAIKDRGGLTIVQDPATADSRNMPDAAIEATTIDHVLPLQDIIDLLNKTDERIKLLFG